MSTTVQISDTNCRCATCILINISALEKERRYDEAEKIFNESIKFFSTNLKRLENEKKSYLNRRNANQDVSKNFHVQDFVHHDTGKPLSPDCQFIANKVTKSITSASSTIVKNKVMFNEKLVYPDGADGREYQFEEIMAVRYLKRQPLLAISFNTAVRYSGAENVSTVAEKKLTPKKLVDEDEKSPFKAPTPKRSKFSTSIRNQRKTIIGTPYIEKIYVEITDKTESSNHNEKVTEQESTNSICVIHSSEFKEKNVHFESPIENSNLSSNFDNGHCNNKDTVSNVEVSNKLALPSSTPIGRESQVFNNALSGKSPCYLRFDADGDDCNHLSAILEASKEQYTSSSNSGDLVTVKTKSLSGAKQKLQIIVEEKMVEVNEFLKPNVVDDPFDEEQNKSFLKMIKFPCEHHVDGFYKTSAYIPIIKNSSIIKLGTKKYCFDGDIGKGSYARVVKAYLTTDSAKKIAIKIQKPACIWEYYISREIVNRLSSNDEKGYFLHYHNIQVYKNGSLSVSEWAKFGSVLKFVNSLKIEKIRCPESIVVHLGIQMITALQLLHNCCKIIHGDVKPDNFVICQPISPAAISIKLIDFGRSIDMSFFPEYTMFQKVVNTEDFCCNEMKDGRLWSYHTDYYGVAGTIYLILNSEYMKTKKQDDGSWTLSKTLPRYVDRKFWNPIFEKLLNAPPFPNLSFLEHIKSTLLVRREEINMELNEACKKICSILNNSP